MIKEKQPPFIINQAGKYYWRLLHWHWALGTGGGASNATKAKEATPPSTPAHRLSVIQQT
jgi:hypothetical protein